MTIDLETNAPDWDRVIVDALRGGKPAPVGDPLTWGGRASIPSGLCSQPPWTQFDSYQELYTQVIVNTRAPDTYARGWSLVGSLLMPTSMWDSDEFYAALEIVLGIGQTTFSQEIVLSANIVDASEPFGLCNQQLVYNGGPYSETYPNGGSGATTSARAFAAIGAFVANSISVRGVLRHASEGGSVNEPIVFTLGVAPIAAGHGI
ncbi:MAG TPA: hypothetical protein VJO33_02390 [Gemmatimonadaceae bacterium]|nr:hypothetical protein [Gemmatimonadaceae bacterium]